MKRSVAAVLAVILMNTAVQAQDAFPTMDWSFVGQWGVDKAIGEEIVAPRRNEKTPPPPALKAATLDFTPSLTRRRANYDSYVAQTRTTNATQADVLAKMFAKVDVVQLMAAPMAKSGLRTTNLGDAFAMWWFSAWSVAHGVSTEPTAAAMRAIKAQAATAMLANPGLARETDAQKQQTAEALIIQTVIMIGAYQGNQANPAALKQFQATVRSNVRAQGLDLDAITLTERGFVAVEPKR